MTDQPARRPNGAQLGLVVFGILLLLGGIVGAVLLKGSAEGDAATEEFTIVLSGGPVTDVAPDYTGMWIAIIVAGLGAVMLIGAAVAAAAKR